MGAYRNIAIDSNLLLAAAQTVTATGNNVGEVSSADVYLEVLPGQPYLARIELGTVVTNDGDETYTFSIEEASATGFGTILNAHKRTLAAAVASGADEVLIGFVPESQYVRLNTTVAGTTPSVIINLAPISALK